MRKLNEIESEIITNLQMLDIPQTLEDIDGMSIFQREFVLDSLFSLCSLGLVTADLNDDLEDREWKLTSNGRTYNSGTEYIVMIEETVSVMYEKHVTAANYLDAAKIAIEESKKKGNVLSAHVVSTTKKVDL